MAVPVFHHGALRVRRLCTPVRGYGELLLDLRLDRRRGGCPRARRTTGSLVDQQMDEFHKVQ